MSGEGGLRHLEAKGAMEVIADAAVVAAKKVAAAVAVAGIAVVVAVL
jgi:hypothetical protein